MRSYKCWAWSSKIKLFLYSIQIHILYNQECIPRSKNKCEIPSIKYVLSCSYELMSKIVYGMHKHKHLRFSGLCEISRRWLISHIIVKFIFIFFPNDLTFTMHLHIMLSLYNMSPWGHHLLQVYQALYVQSYIWRFHINYYACVI